MTKFRDKTQHGSLGLKVWCLLVLTVLVCVSGQTDEHVPDVEIIVKKD